LELRVFPDLGGYTQLPLKIHTNDPEIPETVFLLICMQKHFCSKIPATPGLKPAEWDTSAKQRLNKNQKIGQYSGLD
jgi:hypothetical protein